MREQRYFFSTGCFARRIFPALRRGQLSFAFKSLSPSAIRGPDWWHAKAAAVPGKQKIGSP
jgi:hypothetical protein